MAARGEAKRSVRVRHQARAPAPERAAPKDAVRERAQPVETTSEQAAPVRKELEGAERMPPSHRPRGRRPFSSLTLRILAINVLALAILLGGLLYLDQYRDRLIEAKIAALRNEAEIIAGALGQSSVTGDLEARVLDPELTRRMVGRLVVLTRNRARVFGSDGALLADSRELGAAGREVQSAILPPQEDGNALLRAAAGLYDWIAARLPADRDLSLYNEAPDQRTEDYRETAEALEGTGGSALRVSADGGLVVSVAVPVQQFKKVLGALMLSADGDDIKQSVREVRLAIFQVFLLALAITVLLSLFLAGTIARPIRRLAEAARKVRPGLGRRPAIPDFTGRRDEIGDLSGALSDMTAALYQRLDAIETFAADVAHEIKNPLTSLQSAVESLPRVKDPEKRDKLIAIMHDDVARLNRLITDISNASRLDAELSRAVTSPVDLGRLLETMVEIYRATAADGLPALELNLRDGSSLTVDGIEDQLGQVVRNLLANAVSFSPPDGVIRLRAARAGGDVVLIIEDQGSGIPEQELEAVFERFYILRPDSEAFGTHSGLGLSISRQIVEAHGGTIRAENAKDAAGRVTGARFTVRLPG